MILGILGCGRRAQYEEGKVVMQRLCTLTAVISGFLFGMASADEEEIKLSDCPKAVQKTFQSEAKGAKIETVTREKEGDAEASTGLKSSWAARRTRLACWMTAHSPS